jgi:hypothetical protein
VLECIGATEEVTAHLRAISSSRVKKEEEEEEEVEGDRGD